MPFTDFSGTNPMQYISKGGTDRKGWRLRLPDKKEEYSTDLDSLKNLRDKWLNKQPRPPLIVRLTDGGKAYDYHIFKNKNFERRFFKQARKWLEKPSGGFKEKGSKQKNTLEQLAKRFKVVRPVLQRMVTALQEKGELPKREAVIPFEWLKRFRPDIVSEEDF